MLQVEFILYVRDPSISRDFYKFVLGVAPILDVPGMTEFELGSGCKLGLMPEQGIARIISPPMRASADGNGIPRCELYLLVKFADAYCKRALQAGAMLVSPFAPRDWGDSVAYFADPDGHILAIAEKTLE